MRKKKTLAAAGLLAAAAFTLSACGSDGGNKPIADVSVEAGSNKAATLLDQPFEKPDLVLTDTHARSTTSVRRPRASRH